jgi:riboflavin biosynthesis pyrimidine reductase
VTKPATNSATTTAPPTTPPLPALELLHERAGLPVFGLPAALQAAHGGDLGFSAPRLFANFVSSVDGVVALPGGRESGQVISGSNPADKLMMGLLRACADAVLLGAGTLRRAGPHLWHPERIYPPAAPLFAELRLRRGMRPRPLFVLVTASGEIDVAHPALADAIVVTSAAGEARLRGRLPAGARIEVAAGQPALLGPVLQRLRDEGLRVVLTEGGPSLVGRLLGEGLLDELFLTTAPALFGRFDGDQRKSLVEGLDAAGAALDLLSARRHGSFLFLRYAIAAATAG